MSLWQPTPSTNDLIVWGRCSEYFEFLCRLFRRLLGLCLSVCLLIHLSIYLYIYLFISLLTCLFVCLFLFYLESEQHLLSIDVRNMLSKELEWLENVSIPEPPCHEVQTLLAGHLNLCTALFSCNGMSP